jgi:hypothetical protein
LIYLNNSSIADIVCKNMPENEEKWKRKNRVMSYFCGIIENEITYKAYKFLVDNNYIIRRRGSWGYDGITFKRPKNVDLNFLVEGLNEYVKKHTGFNSVSFIQKEFDNDEVLWDVLDNRQNAVVAKLVTPIPKSTPKKKLKLKSRPKTPTSVAESIDKDNETTDDDEKSKTTDDDVAGETTDDDETTDVDETPDVDSRKKTIAELIQHAKNISMKYLKSGDFDDWRNMMWALRSVGDDKYKQIAFKLAERCGRNDKYVNEYWNNYDSSKGITIGTFLHYSKISNNKKYQKIINKYIVNNNSGNDKIAQTDVEARDILFEELKPNFKSYESRLVFKEGNIWIENPQKIDDYVLNYILKSNINTRDSNGNIKPYCQNITKAEQIKKALLIKIRCDNQDDNLITKFHQSCKDAICFVDGVLYVADFKFIKWVDVKEYHKKTGKSYDNIYSCRKIYRPYGDYFAKPDWKIIDEIKTFFDNSYGDKCKLALQFLARALTGNNQDKSWATYLANRNSGKGCEYELLKQAFGDYVGSFSVSNILYNRKGSQFDNTTDAKKMYWCLEHEFTRLAISQEVPDSKSQQLIKSVIFKKLTGGGDDITAKCNYDRVDTTIKMDTTFYIKGNNSVQPDEPDCNKTRLEFSSYISYVSKNEMDLKIEKVEKGLVNPEALKKFKLKDDTLKVKFGTTEYKNAMVYLLLEYYTDTPVQICNTETVEEEGFNIDEDINENIEFTNNKEDMVLKTAMEDRFTTYDKNILGLGLKALNILKSKCNNRGHKYLNKMVYKGCKLKEIKEEIIQEETTKLN